MTTWLRQILFNPNKICSVLISTTAKKMRNSHEKRSRNTYRCFWVNFEKKEGQIVD